jgi:hypothetical protein
MMMLEQVRPVEEGTRPGSFQMPVDGLTLWEKTG